MSELQRVETCVAMTLGGIPEQSLINRCESVAEQAFAAGFMLGTFKRTAHADHWVVELEGVTFELRAQLEITYARDPWGHAMPQEQAFARADFAFTRGGEPVLLVEVDGHEWHERSPKQVQRDRSRDRALLRCGLRVARFTATEVLRDAKGCAVEAFALACELVGAGR